MSMVMFQVRMAHKPQLHEIATEFGLDMSELDESYGVIGTDERKGLYVCLIDERAAPKVKRAIAEKGLDGDPAVGVFSNVKVEPMEGDDPTFEM